MAEKLKRGDRVSWSTSQGETAGKVKKKLTHATAVKGHKVAATPDEPQYLVQSEKSGKVAAHKPGALKKRRPRKKRK